MSRKTVTIPAAPLARPGIESRVSPEAWVFSRPAVVANADPWVAFGEAWATLLGEGLRKHLADVERLAACRSPLDLLAVQNRIALEAFAHRIEAAQAFSAALSRALGAGR